MSRETERVSFPCPKCGQDGTCNITDFEPNILVKAAGICPQNHLTKVSVRNKKVLFIQEPQPNNLDRYTTVPSHFVEFAREVNKCFDEEVPRAAVTLVRLMLDCLLYEMNFTDDYLGAKVKKLENACNNKSNPICKDYPTICGRSDNVFRAISNLSGYHAHAQPKIMMVGKAEFAAYFHAVEQSIMEKWPK